MEELDKLAADFAAGHYAAGGAELEGAPAGAPHQHGQEHQHGHGEPAATHGHGEGIRRFTHLGHEVEIVTRYEVTIDGQPWDQHLEVLPDGSVTYHGLPQYAVPSAVDLIRTVIEYGYEVPEDLREAFRAAREEE
jgi:hypothetical protein